MPVSRSHASAVARIGQALADETRTRTMLALRGGAAYPSDLAESLGVSRQVMSNHLADLRGRGLVEATREGRRTRYRLADDAVGSAFGTLLTLALRVAPGCATEDCACRRGDHPVEPGLGVLGGGGGI